MAEPVIRVEGLTKIFGPDPPSVLPRIQGGQPKDRILAETGHVVALRDVGLDIAPGEIFVVMGLSGCGKSTLVRHLNRLVEPTAGTVTVMGVDVMALDELALEKFRRDHISMVFQRFGLMPHMTVLENAAFGLEVREMPKQAREATARDWLARLGLDGYEGQYPAQLSGGQQQRVGLARALATEPTILLMDEPFSALDPLIRSELQAQLLELQKSLAKTIVFVSHDLNEALRLGDRIAILDDGRVVQVGRPRDIVLEPANDFVAAFVRDVDRARALAAGEDDRNP